MKKLTCLLAAALALLLCAPATAAEQKPLRHQYTLDFTLDTEQKSYSGTETVLVVNTSGDTWDELCFRDYATVADLAQRQGYRDAGGKEVFYEPDETSSVLENAHDPDTGEVLPIHRDSADPSFVYIPLQKPLKSGESRRIEFQYSAQLFWGKGTLCWQEEKGAAFFNMGNFFPILAVYEDGKWQGEPFSRDYEYFYSPVSDYRVTLTAPAGYTAAGSTAAKSTARTRDGGTRWTYEGKSMRDFALCVSASFECKTAMSGGVKVYSYYPKGRTLNGETQLQAAADALAIYGEAFGYPYPYDSFTVVSTTVHPSGMEFPGLVMIYNMDSFDNELVREREVNSLRTTVVHEVAHQWFYAAVGSNSGAQPWLDEGLAKFAELYYWENMNPAEYQLSVDHLRDQCANVAPHSLSLTGAEMGQEHGRVAYSYGRAFLYDLREALGRDLFDQCLREYVGRYAMKEAHTADFIAIFSRTDAARAVIDQYF